MAKLFVVQFLNTVLLFQISDVRIGNHHFHCESELGFQHQVVPHLLRQIQGVLS